MRPGDFRFEPLLKYKAFVEETMRNEFLDVAGRLDIEEERLFALEEIWRRAVEDLEHRQTMQVHPHEIFMYHTYLQQISLEIETQRKRVHETRKVYHEKRESLVDASQERKIVEKVKEKDARGIIEEAKREEKKLMDETAKNRYLRDNC